MKKFFFGLTVLCVFATAFSQGGAPASYYSYQNAVYGQTLELADMNSLYTQAVKDIDDAPFANEKKLALLAYLEELRIRGFLLYGNTMAAEESLAQGIASAEKSLAAKPSADGYAALAALYSIGTKVKPGSMISMGLKIQNTTKKALKLDSENPVAVHLQASGNVYAPVPFRNLKKGVAQVKDYLAKINPETISRGELFNLTICLADAYQMLEDAENTSLWLEKSARLFPDNKSVTERDFLNLK